MLLVSVLSETNIEQRSMLGSSDTVNRVESYLVTYGLPTVPFTLTINRISGPYFRMLNNEAFTPSRLRVSSACKYAG